jgi:hypothetical protein
VKWCSSPVNYLLKLAKVKKANFQDAGFKIHSKLSKGTGKVTVVFLSFSLFPLTLFLLPSFVKAQSTPAGTRIQNEATGTYQDPNTGEVREVISNTVTITVAEVAGITVTAAGFIEADGNSNIEAGDLLYFEFLVTNVGNDPTRFNIPDLATITGPGTVSDDLQISIDGGETWVDIAAGSTLPGFTFSDDAVITQSYLPGQAIRVRVPVTINQNAIPSDSITVKLGQTPNNAQNVQQTAEPADVFTVDNSDGAPGETTGIPVNGTREASNTQTASISARPLALATILKTHALPVNVRNPNLPNDDLITYNLALQVESRTPGGSENIVPADLAGTEINLNGNTVTRVLIADGVPAQTQLTGTRTAPSGWQVVFSADDPAAFNALEAQWFTDPNNAAIGGLANVQRIGFIFNGTIAKGTTVSGFSFQVVTSGVTTTTNIYNIAQVIGSTDGDPDSLVFDESGDQSPSNFNDDGTSPPTDSNGNPIINNGIPDPTGGVDNNNNNSGRGPGGEPNVVPIGAPSSGLQNGPPGNPGTIGPRDDNDDFVNKNTPIPPGLDPNQPIDPGPVGFTNTVQNTSGAPSTVTLLPTPPDNPNDLPAGTQVTITYGGRSVTYTYTPQAGFTATQPPIVIPNLGPNVPTNYNVDIDLPSTEQLRGYPVPITAFIDQDGDGEFDANEPNNRKIDRVYTGFLELLKESRVLQGTGPAVPEGQDVFSTSTKTPASGNILEFRFTYTNISIGGGPENITLTARNIVINEEGTTFNETTNPSGNNWALDNDNSDRDNNLGTGIDTSHIVGSAVDSTGGQITFFTGRPATTSTPEITGNSVNNDVTRYVNTIPGPIPPGASGTFRFQRRVN